MSMITRIGSCLTVIVLLTLLAPAYAEPLPPLKSLVFSTPLSFNWSDPDFDHLISTLDGTTDFTGQTLTMYVTGTGGVTLAMENVARAIERARTKGLYVNMVVTSQAQSSHAYLLCAADRVVIKQGAGLMFHENYAVLSTLFNLISWRSSGDQIDHSLSANIINRCIKKNILTENDKVLLTKGKQIIIINDKGTLKKFANDDPGRWLSIIQQVGYLIALILGGLGLVALIKRV